MSAIAENTAVHPLNLTEGAVKQLRSIVQEQNIPAQYGLRVGVKGGGCSGFSYVLGFDEPKEGDDVLTINGMRVLMQKSHAILNNRGFSFSNPNAKETCGCGTSFAA
jgi:iron-sulfur cluster assembly protein